VLELALERHPQPLSDEDVAAGAAKAAGPPSAATGEVIKH
jgi:hypothetical protein